MRPEEVREARKTLSMTQAEFAAACGVSRPVAQKWELEGAHHRPIPEEKAAHIAAMLAPPRDEQEASAALATTPRYTAPTKIRLGGVVMMSNDRVAIIGAPGSGKTWLATRMLRVVGAFVVLTADDRSVPDSVAAMMPDVPVTTFFNPSLAQQIVCVPDTFTREEKKWQAWDAVLRAIFQHGNRVVYCDELTAISPGTSPRLAFGELIMQGRKRNIGVWTGMQRPRGVPRIALASAEHFHLLSMTDPGDRAYIGGFIGVKHVETIPRKNRAVLYCNPKEGRTQYEDLDATRREPPVRSPEQPPVPPALRARVREDVSSPAVVALNEDELRVIETGINGNAYPVWLAGQLGLSVAETMPIVRVYFGSTAKGREWLQLHAPGVPQPERKQLAPPAHPDASAVAIREPGGVPASYKSAVETLIDMGIVEPPQWAEAGIPSTPPGKFTPGFWESRGVTVAPPPPAKATQIPVKTQRKSPARTPQSPQPSMTAPITTVPKKKPRAQVPREPRKLTFMERLRGYTDQKKG